MRFFMLVVQMFGNQIACAAVAIYITEAFDLTIGLLAINWFARLTLPELQ